MTSGPQTFDPSVAPLRRRLSQLPGAVAGDGAAVMVAQPRPLAAAAIHGERAAGVEGAARRRVQGRGQLTHQAHALMPVRRIDDRGASVSSGFSRRVSKLLKALSAQGKRML